MHSNTTHIELRFNFNKKQVTHVSVTGDYEFDMVPSSSSWPLFVALYQMVSSTSSKCRDQERRVQHPLSANKPTIEHEHEHQHQHEPAVETPVANVKHLRLKEASQPNASTCRQVVGKRHRTDLPRLLSVSPPWSAIETVAEDDYNYDSCASQPHDPSRPDASVQSRSTETVVGKNQHKACHDDTCTHADNPASQVATRDDNLEGGNSKSLQPLHPMLPDVQGSLLSDHIQKVLTKIRARIAEGSELTVERHELNLRLLCQPIQSQQVIPLAPATNGEAEAAGAAHLEDICSAVPAALGFGKWRQADRNAKRGLGIKEWLDALLESACFLCIETRYRRVKSCRKQKYHSPQVASQKTTNLMLKDARGRTRYWLTRERRTAWVVGSIICRLIEHWGPVTGNHLFVILADSVTISDLVQLTPYAENAVKSIVDGIIATTSPADLHLFAKYRPFPFYQILRSNLGPDISDDILAESVGWFPEMHTWLRHMSEESGIQPFQLGETDIVHLDDGDLSTLQEGTCINNEIMDFALALRKKTRRAHGQDKYHVSKSIYLPRLDIDLEQYTLLPETYNGTDSVLVPILTRGVGCGWVLVHVDGQRKEIQYYTPVCAPHSSRARDYITKAIASYLAKREFLDFRVINAGCPLAPRPVPIDSGLAVLKLAESHVMGWPVFEKTEWKGIRARLIWAVYSARVYPETECNVAMPRSLSVVGHTTLSEYENTSMVWCEYGRKRKKREIVAVPEAISQLHHLMTSVRHPGSSIGPRRSKSLDSPCASIPGEAFRCSAEQHRSPLSASISKGETGWDHYPESTDSSTSRTSTTSVSEEEWHESSSTPSVLPGHSGKGFGSGTGLSPGALVATHPFQDQQEAWPDGDSFFAAYPGIPVQRAADEGEWSANRVSHCTNIGSQYAWDDMSSDNLLFVQPRLVWTEQA